MSGEGNTNTKDEPKKDDNKDNNAQGGQSDGLIGNRRIRTFIIGGILIGYGLFFWAYFGGNFYGTLIAIAQIVLLVAIIILIVLHCLKQENAFENIIGWIIVVCGAIILVVIILQAIDVLSVYSGSYVFVLFGTAILPACTAIFLGLDAAKNFMAVESRRLFANLLALSIATGAMTIGYGDQARAANATKKLCAGDQSCIQFFNQLYGGWATGSALVATGSAVIMVTCIVYLVLFICTCCTCNCKDNKCIRMILSIALVIGGLITAIGFFILINSFIGGNGLIGDAILVVGLSITWAIDIGLIDAVKGGGK